LFAAPLLPPLLPFLAKAPLVYYQSGIGKSKGCCCAAGNSWLLFLFLFYSKSEHRTGNRGRQQGEATGEATGVA